MGWEGGEERRSSISNRLLNGRGIGEWNGKCGDHLMNHSERVIFRHILIFVPRWKVEIFFSCVLF